VVIDGCWRLETGRKTVIIPQKELVRVRKAEDYSSLLSHFSFLLSAVPAFARNLEESALSEKKKQGEEFVD
jgi:hypothetical protein